MKKRTKLIVALGCASMATFALAACSSVWDTPYDELDPQDYTVSVRYDVNGGTLASQSQTNAVDVFSAEDAKEGVRLLEPGSEERGKDASYTVADRSGYYLAGWYRTRELRTDASGNAVDEYGDLCSESGNPQGYTYSQKWDFKNDIFKVTESQTSSQVSMTLYAAWVPYFKYQFKYTDGKGETVTLTKSFNPGTQEHTLRLPYWEDEQEGVDVTECSAAMVYGDFPSVEGTTFSELYTDSAMQNKVETATIEHAGRIDEATATVTNGIVTYHLKLLDGVWYHIYTADQFKANANIAGYYAIYRDLDFEGKSWSNGLVRGDFTGQIYGNGHTFKNIKVTQSDYNDQMYGGLFGRLMKGSVVENLTFENVKYELNAASRKYGGQFGLFAGFIDPKAKIENVTISGELHIGNANTNYDAYTVGLVSANYTSLGAELKAGISANIALIVDKVQSGTSTIWPHIATVAADGNTVELKANPDREKDPSQN